MSKAANNAQIMMGRIGKLIGVLILAYGVYVIVANRQYIKHRGQKKYQVERYGHTWNTNLRSAKQQAETYRRQVMIVFIHSGSNDAASNNLIKKIFPSKDFQHAINTYIPVLCDIQQGVTPLGGLKTNQEEIMKEYDLQPERAGVLLLISPDGKDLSRVSYSNETAPVINTKLAGGKFVALKPIIPPQFKLPLLDLAASAADKARNAVAEGTINPPEEEISPAERAAAEPAPESSDKPAETTASETAAAETAAP